MAMASATGVFIAPKSWRAASTVSHGAHHQRREHPEVDAERHDVRRVRVVPVPVLRHQCFPPIRYSSGNRKIQTMSTKCQ